MYYFFKDKPKVFSGFAGFGAASTPSSGAFSNFNFGKTPAAGDATASSGNATINFSFGSKQTAESETPKKENGTVKTVATSAENEEEVDVEFIANMTKLNKTVSTWITEHIFLNF